MKTLIILFSYHHNNTEKITNVIASALGAEIKKPEQVSPESIAEYDLVGLGSGIYFGKHHKVLLDLADRFPQSAGKKAFIFSTSGDNRNPAKMHQQLKDKLENKGYTIVGEFNCAGYDTYGALKIVGGIKKGRPNGEDLKNAEAFAQTVKQKTTA
jgi:flavodoxin